MVTAIKGTEDVATPNQCTLKQSEKFLLRHGQET